VDGSAVVISLKPQTEKGFAVTTALEFRADASSFGQVPLLCVWPLAELGFFGGVCG
jgi:hypothetical protein